MKQMLKRTGALFLTLCLTLSVCGVLTPLPAAAAAVTSGDYKYWIGYDNTATITKYLGSGGDVTIPDTLDGHTVVEITYDAFRNCVELTSVDIPDSVILIKGGAFLDCTGLTSVNIPDSVTYIGEEAFSGCTGLTTVTIPDSVTTIDRSAFEDCTGLTSVDIPDSVTTIGKYAFSRCNRLISAVISKSVTEIGDDVFSGCTSLTSITVDRENPNFSSKDGVLFNKDQTTLIQYALGKSGNYTIPDSVTAIEDDAFEGCTGLASVDIPGSVTTIGAYAFGWCTGLTSLIIGDSVTSIGFGAFEGCTKLTSVTISNSVTTIDNGAFMDCIGLTLVTIPYSVTTIGNGAFLGCTGLTSIVVDANNPNYSSKDGILFNKDQTELIQYPDGKSGNYTIPDSVTTINRGAFSYCPGLTSVIISNSVIKIDIYAFRDCTGLTSVTILNGMTRIDNDAFYDCDNFTIYGYSGSTAERFANEKGIPFITILSFADYTAVDAALAKVPEDLSGYTAETAQAVKDAIAAVERDLPITEQARVNAMAKAIEDAVAKLQYKPADYTAVDAALQKVPEDLSGYTAETAQAVKDAVAAVVRDLPITEQARVNAMAKAIEDAVAALKKAEKPAVLGDMDGDGKVSVTDALAILRMAVGLSTPVDNADIDGMNGVTVTDALAALRIAVGLA